jgi:hypothetical protein
MVGSSVPEAVSPTETPVNPNHYWRYQVRHRRRKLVSWRRLVLIIIVTAAAVLWLPRDVNGNLQLADMATAILTFAAISFGACLTGAVLALTIPSDAQRRELAAHKVSVDSRFTDFSDLVFTFTWSAMCQLPLVLLALVAYFVGGSIRIPSGHFGGHLPELVVLGLMAVAGVNAFGQLTTVVKTISQLAHVGPLLDNLDQHKES